MWRLEISANPICKNFGGIAYHQVHVILSHLINYSTQLLILGFDMLKSSTRGFAIVMNVSFSSTLKLTLPQRQSNETNITLVIQVLTLA